MHFKLNKDISKNIVSGVLSVSIATTSATFIHWGISSHCFDKIDNKLEEAEQSLDLLEKSIIEETMQRKQLDEKLNKKMDQLEGAFLQNAYLLVTNDKEYHFVYLLGYEENTYYLMDLFEEEIVYPYSFYETSSYLYPIADYFLGMIIWLKSIILLMI